MEFMLKISYNVVILEIQLKTLFVNNNVKIQ